MRNHHYGSAFRVVNSRKKLHDAVRGLVVEITGRLISDDYTGLVQQRSCNGDSLLLSAGSCASPPTSPLTRCWTRRPSPPSASAPSRRRISLPSRATASSAGCWRRRRPRRTACAPMWSRRWWHRLSWRQPSPPIITSSAILPGGVRPDIRS